jgi:hypothetical protein
MPIRQGARVRASDTFRIRFRSVSGGGRGSKDITFADHEPGIGSELGAAYRASYRRYAASIVDCTAAAQLASVTEPERSWACRYPAGRQPGTRPSRWLRLPERRAAEVDPEERFGAGGDRGEQADGLGKQLSDIEMGGADLFPEKHRIGAARGA